jgi:phage gpG-like protein
MMLTLSLRDGVSPALAAMPARLRDALSNKGNIIAAALLAKIRDKLSGAVLNSKTGALARSIVATIDDSADLSVTIASSGDIKYAAIQEYGGTIPPHEILPDKAKALAFAVGGKQGFAARVNLPAITLPERSYMRSSLAEMADEIRDGLSEAVAEAFR